MKTVYLSAELIASAGVAQDSLPSPDGISQSTLKIIVIAGQPAFYVLDLLKQLLKNRQPR